MGDQESKLTTSDTVLIEHARSGDTSAFAELWRRHYRPAARVARQFTASIDADDLVSEAYARIFQRVLAGGGPTGAFRPYLYTTIRNIASTWGAANRDVQVDMIEDFEDERIPDDPAAWALDRTLTARAFRSLPERWQTVLWYTEVEGMDPHEVAPIMGITANGVAALSYRAREGLRKAWLQAHVSDATASGECQWTMSRLGENARKSLTAREQERVDAHLATCAKCTIVSEEVDEVGSHLAMVMLPLLLGGIAGGGLLATLAAPASATAATLAIPALPAAVQAVAGGSAFAAPVIGGLALGAASGTGVLVGSLAVAAVIGGSLALGLAPQAQNAHADPAPTSTHQVLAGPGVDPTVSAPAVDPAGVALPSPSPSPTDGVIGSVVAPIVGGLGDVVGGVIGAITPPSGSPVDATVALNLTGTGTPGATVTASVAGSLYTTIVASDGTFALHISGLPAGTNSATLSQKAGGAIGSLLNLLGITTPLSIDTGPLGISIILLN